MTRITYLVILAIIILLQLFFYIYIHGNSRKKNYNLSSSPVFLATALTLVFYGLTLIFKDRNVVNTAYSLYFASIDWLLFFLFDFGKKVILKGTLKNKYHLIGKIFLLFTVADSLSFLMNIYYQTAFDLKGFYNASENVINWVIIYRPAYMLHLFLCYAIVVPIFVVLIRNSFRGSKVFRYKYLLTLVTFTSYFVLNGIFMTFHWALDYSILFFIPMSVEVFLLAYVYLPRGMVDNILQEASEQLRNGVVCYDLEGNCIFLNDFSKKLFGNDGNAKNRSEDYLKQWLKENINETNSDQDEIFSYDNEFYFNNTNSYIDIEYHKQFDKNKRLIGSYLRFEDRTEDIKNLEKEKYRATHDKLTGLLNREGFFAKVEESLKDNPYTPMYLISTDYANFKLINDIYGKEVGDRILKFQATIMNRIGLKLVCAGRVSGDKFGMLSKKCDFDGEKLIEYTQKALALSRNISYRLHLYIGVYEITDANESVSSMYDKAHLAIENIDGQYDKVLAFYDEKLMEQLLAEKEVVSDFSQALEDNQIKMYIQPQIRAKDNLIIGGEALARWVHPEKGFLTPDKFVKSLEKNGLIYEMDYFIWESAAKKLSEWKKSGDEYLQKLSISVNISTKDFYHADLYKVFTNFVKKYDIDPSLLKLEVTETVVVQDVNIFRAVLKHLKQFGFVIEMDDFGSGYSSLNALMDFSMDVLKIDMEFLRNTENLQLSSDVVELIVRLAKSLDMTVITEGVETKEHVDFLNKCGCDIFQGYYFAKPMPVSQFDELVNKEKEEVNGR